ncbi:MAG: YkgJ family cysteine cluster protein [Spirochaetia bacterium]|jgi:Fe-S-cluster containining protein
MMQDIFYKSGLRFECTRCSKCCRHTPGYVFLSTADLAALSKSMRMTKEELLHRYCRTIDLGAARRVSLKEKPNFDCILWENSGCSRYDARPLQCRSFPFWSTCVASREEWENQARNCPGMGKGKMHSREKIEGWLARRVNEGFLEG